MRGILHLTGGTAEKQSYASSVTAPSLSNATNSRSGKESVIARQSNHNGMPATIFKSKDYYGIMAEECKYTIVGSILKPRPQIDRIRSKFKETISIKGSCKISVYDNYNAFLDFTNDEDFKSVCFKRVIELDGMQMWLQKWTPDFKPEEDIPISPVWVLLPGLPYHMHSWQYVKQIVSSIGTPLVMDAATTSKTRPSMAKVRVELDLLKSHPDSVWVGIEDEGSPLKGFTQKLEYETIPKYCKHCKKIGHNVMNCRIWEKIMAKAEEEKNKKDEEFVAEQSMMKENKDIEEEKHNNKEEETVMVQGNHNNVEENIIFTTKETKATQGTTIRKNEREKRGKWIL